jgi:hypothetical protein
MNIRAIVASLILVITSPLILGSSSVAVASSAAEHSASKHASGDRPPPKTGSKAKKRPKVTKAGVVKVAKASCTAVLWFNCVIAGQAPSPGDMDPRGQFPAPPRRPPGITRVDPTPGRKQSAPMILRHPVHQPIPGIQWTPENSGTPRAPRGPWVAWTRPAPPVPGCCRTPPAPGNSGTTGTPPAPVIPIRDL